MSEIDRRQMLVFLRATVATASAPVLAAKGRRRRVFTVKSFPLSVGSQITGIAENEIPKDAVAWARSRWAERDLTWPDIGTQGALAGSDRAVISTWRACDGDSRAPRRQMEEPHLPPHHRREIGCCVGQALAAARAVLVAAD